MYKHAWITAACMMAMPIGADAGTAAGERRTWEEIACPAGSIATLAEGTGPTVVIVPSRARDSIEMDALAAALAAGGNRVLRPQPRGMAGSLPNRVGETMDDYADDLACVLDHFGGDSAVMVGHAYGNWVVRVFATRYPARTRGVVLAAAAARNFPSELVEGLDRIIHEVQPEPERRRLVARLFFAPGNDPSGLLQGWYPKAALAQISASKAPAREVWWAAGSAPLLEIQGLHDPWMPAANHGDLQAEFGQRVTTRQIADASHALVVERPDAVAAEMLQWMARLPR